VVVIGAGFTGLAAAYQLVRLGRAVTVLEQANDVGGLAGSFEVNGEKLEKFYHHWFLTDEHIMQLIRDLGCTDNIVRRATRTGCISRTTFLTSARHSTFLDSNRLDKWTGCVWHFSFCGHEQSRTGSSWSRLQPRNGCHGLVAERFTELFGSHFCAASSALMHLKSRPCGLEQTKAQGWKP
jgi:choline dehydrogenase-like flavoprotein